MRASEDRRVHNRRGAGQLLYPTPTSGSQKLLESKSYRTLSPYAPQCPEVVTTCLKGLHADALGLYRLSFSEGARAKPV